MTADLQDLFDQAGRNPPAPTLDPDAVLLRARRSRNRRVTGAVAAAAVVTLALGLGVASHELLRAAPVPATHPTESTTHRPVSTGKLAYEINGDIYLADADGQNPVRIADGRPNGDTTCRQYGGDGSLWSPDGRYLAYRGDVPSGGGPCQGTVFIRDPSGDPVASFPGEGWLISWSPDSARIATWDDLFHTIGIYGLDGARQALLSLPDGLLAAGDFDPVWSPDGSSLLVPFGVEIPVDGSTPRRLPADDPRSQWMATYSPDGTQVAYIPRNRTASLNVASADGSNARVLIPSGAEILWPGPVWSPSGDRIALASAAGDETTARGLPATELDVVDVASGTVTSLAGKGWADHLRVIEFSPDGDQILFSRTDANNASSLWSVRVDGSDPHLLVAGTYRGDWRALSRAR